MTSDTGQLAALPNQSPSHLAQHTGPSPEQVELLKRTICKGASDDELLLFTQVCGRMGLDPFARQIFPVKRWDSTERKNVMSIQVSIDGFRLTAQRTGKYRGQLGPYWCGSDGEWKDVWLHNTSPVAAKVGVLHADFKEPLWAVARFDAYKQLTRDNTLNSMWSKMGDLMIAKCAEALALRKAFPQELSGVYTSDEMGQASVEGEVVESIADPHAVPQQSQTPRRSKSDEPAPQKTIDLCNEWFQYALQNGYQDAQGRLARRIKNNPTRGEARDYLKVFNDWEAARQAPSQEAQQAQPTTEVSTQQQVVSNAVEGEVIENSGEHPEAADKRWAELHARYSDSTAYQSFVTAAAERKLPWGMDVHVAALENGMEGLHDVMFIAEDMELHDWEEAATAVRDGLISWTGDGTLRQTPVSGTPVLNPEGVMAQESVAQEQEQAHEPSEHPGAAAPTAAPAQS